MESAFVEKCRDCWEGAGGESHYFFLQENKWRFFCLVAPSLINALFWDAVDFYAWDNLLLVPNKYTNFYLGL
jgi:hypothetical protein